MYIYQVRERMFMRKGEEGEYCGLRFYSSLKKAEKDLNDRMLWYNNATLVEDTREGQEFLTINKVLQLPSGGYIEFDLQKHIIE